MREHHEDTWLRPELERHLRQVAAPEELWERIQRPRAEEGRMRIAPLVWLAAATVTAAAVWGFFPRTEGRERMDLRAGTYPEIRAWVKAQTGMDLPLPSEAPRAVRVRSVCAVRGGSPAVEVAYRVDGRDAMLSVAKAGPELSGEARHRFLKCESPKGPRVSRWVMRGQVYTLAFSSPGELRDECLLCHAAAGPLTVAN